MSQSGHFWDPDGQISEWPEDQMVRCPDGQRSGWPEVWMTRSPDVQTARNICVASMTPATPLTTPLIGSTSR